MNAHPALNAPGVVVDTQVVLDWLVFRDVAARALLDAVRAGRLRWLATTPMRAELEHMLRHRSLSRWGHDTERALTFFDSQSIWLPQPTPLPAARLICTDPDDQVFLDTALSYGAAWLATRDRALLKLHRKAHRLGLHIIRPAEWRDGSALLP